MRRLLNFLMLSVKVTFEEIVLISLSLLCQSLFDGSGANVTAVEVSVLKGFSSL